MILADVARSNLLLVPPDRREEWYRHHHLFRDMLLAELERLEPGLTRVLRRRAAEWCLANGWPEEALEYSMAAGDIDVVAGLVEGSLRLACDRGRRRSTGGRWQVPAGYPAGRARSRGLLADRCLDGSARRRRAQVAAAASRCSPRGNRSCQRTVAGPRGPVLSCRSRDRQGIFGGSVNDGRADRISRVGQYPAHVRPGEYGHRRRRAGGSAACSAGSRTAVGR
jgi:hypothetical protein